jgi:hypothetical protein
MSANEEKSIAQILSVPSVDNSGANVKSQKLKRVANSVRLVRFNTQSYI